MNTADPYDCRGGPGTTEPACGACINCLLVIIDRLTVAGDDLALATKSVLDYRATQTLVDKWEEAKRT